MDKAWAEKACNDRMRRLALLYAFAACMITAHAPAQAQVASFDCSRAATPTEQAVCRTPSLGAKDVRMATYYQILQSAHPGVSGMAYREFRDAVRETQAHWLKQQRDVCRDNIACLEQAYDQRIGALHDRLIGNLALTYGRMCDGG